jgi:hypothetical protein
MKIRLMIALCAVCCAVWLPMADAGEVRLSGRFAGTAVSHFQFDDSGNPASFIISEAAFKGALGARYLSVLSQFVPDFTLTTCQQGEVPLSMVYARSVTTFEDLNVFYIDYDSGWMCGRPVPVGMASYYGRVTGQIVGGTERFVGATGRIESDFHGNDLAGPFVVDCGTCAPEVSFPGYGSFLGTMNGELILPK